MQPVQGIHHITAFASDPQANKDRQCFHPIHFRERGRVLFEIATDGPGFSIDELVEPLGTSLKLQPWLEPQRDTLVRVLPSFTQVSHV
jgi:glyoxalase family protein